MLNTASTTFLCAEVLPKGNSVAEVCQYDDSVSAKVSQYEDLVSAEVRQKGNSVSVEVRPKGNSIPAKVCQKGNLVSRANGVRNASSASNDCEISSRFPTACSAFDCLQQEMKLWRETGTSLAFGILMFWGVFLLYTPSVPKERPFARKRRTLKPRSWTRQPGHDDEKPLLGAQFQAENNNDDDPADEQIEQITDLLDGTLKDVGISSLLALSITTSFIAIITTLIGYVKTTGKKSKFLIGAIVLQIIQLILQIVHVTYPDFDAKHLVEFSKKRLNKLVLPPPVIASVTALTSYVRSGATDWEEANRAIATFKREYPRTNIDHVMTIPPPPESEALTIQWMDENHLAAQFWTTGVLKRLYTLTDQQVLLIDHWEPQGCSAQEQKRPLTPYETSDPEWDSDIEKDFEQFLSEQEQEVEKQSRRFPVYSQSFSRRGKPTTTILPTVEEARAALSGATPQIEMTWFKDILSEFVGLLAALVVCIVNFSTGKSVDFSTLSRNWQGVDFLREKFTTSVSKLSKDAQGMTPDEAQQAQVAAYITNLNNLLAIPHTTYASRADLREELDAKCKEVETFLRIPLNSKTVDKTVLFSLYNAANAMRVEIQRASKLQTIRQEPRLVVFYGDGAVGKTKSMQLLANRIGARKYKDIDAQRRTISITARSKYFPLLSGEPIWTVDEIGSSIDYSEEIVFRDLRGLCSSARFGADTAEIQGKDQEATPHIIVATTNTHPDEIMERLCHISGPEACEPSASRMMIYHCVRNEKEYGKIDLNNRDSTPYDKSGKMGHIFYHEMRLNYKTKRYETARTPVSFEAVEHNVSNRMSTLKQQYLNQLNAMMGAQEQVQSVSHFVINFFGKPKAGKGRACDLLIPQLKTATNYPVVQLDRKGLDTIKTKFDRRIILVCDDVMNFDKKDRVQQEQQYMDIFNNYLMPGSIIIFTTNIIPSIGFPHISLEFSCINLTKYIPFVPDVEITLPIFFATQQHLLAVSEPGCLRRMGFTGQFVGNSTEDANISFEVKENQYLEQSRTFDKCNINLQIFLLLASLPFLIFSYYFVVLNLAIIFATLYKISQCGINKYCVSSIFERCYNQYKTYLEVNDMLTIMRGPIVQSDNVDILLEAETVESIYTTVNPIPNIFASKENYLRAELPWKLWVKKDISNALLKIGSKLRGIIPPDTEAGAIEYLSSIRRFMLLEGFSVTISAKIQSVGQFYLEGNIITIVNDEDQLVYVPVMQQDQVTLIPTQHDYPNQRFTYEELAKYHIDSDEILDMKNLNADQIVAMRKALVDVTILKHPSYIQARMLVHTQKVKRFSVRQYALFSEKCREVLSTTTGKIIVVIAGVLITSVVAYGLYKLFSGKPKKTKSKKVRQVLTSDDDSSIDSDTDSDDETFEYQKRRRGGPKPRERSELTDDDKRRRQQRSRGQPKQKKRDNLTDDDERRPRKKQLSSEQVRQRYHLEKFIQQTKFVIEKHDFAESVPQSVQELPDMNGYNEFKNTIGQLHDKIKKNEVFVISLNDERDSITYNTVQERDAVLDKSSRCYGLVVEKHYIVTVGHIYTHIKRYKNNMYCAADEFGNTIYRCQLVKELVSNNRDLSFWKIVESKESKRIPHFPNIRKNFIEDLKSMPEFSDTIIKRYAETKHEQFLYATCMYSEDRIDSVTADGDPFSLEYYGFCWFSFCLLALTTYGDCGLPYYNVIDNNGSKQVKLTGIHCMGNTKDNMAIGISAIVSQRDFRCFDNFKPETEEEQCKFCEDKNMRIAKPLPEKDESDATENQVHEIVWNNDHDAGTRSVIQECKYYFEANKNWEGKVRKSYGVLSQGSERHSHTHFVSNEFLKDPPGTWNQWEEEDTDKWGPKQLVFKRRIANLNALNAFFGDHPWIEEYTMWMKRETIVKTKKGRDKKFLNWWMEILVHKTTLTDEERTKVLRTTPRAEIAKETLPEELASLVEEAEELNYIHDVPIPAQDTVSLCGSLRTSASRIPSNDFVKFPFSSKLENQNVKIPFNGNSNEAPPEQLAQLKLNNFGDFCARTTQSVQWQGEHRRPNVFLAKQIESEFYEHIKKDYADLTELSDKEVMYGFKESRVGLDRLQLKKSIGWSLQALFNVTQKEDVIEVNEKGVYSWLDNPCAKFAKNWYTSAKQTVREGKRSVFFYLDLLKMEKLKPEKNFLGRIFCAADLVDIMIQRKFLGSFVARSTLKDDTVGVGSNPWVVFNNIARNCLAKGNYFTGDYKRWDKTVPAWAFEKLANMLDKANNTNYYKPMFESIYQAYHVSGTTIYHSRRGMPSGALVTANLNSKINDFVLFGAFCKLVGPHMDVSYEIYSKLVYRKFYGDDVIIAVDDSIKDYFDMVQVRSTLSELFGFVLDSSEKDGKIERFMDWNELSWCSRYLRKLEKYNFYVGALKKITINSLLCYERKGNPPEVLAVQLNNAMYEAAAWEREYFDSIVRDIKFIRSKRPEIAQYITIMTYEDCQEDMYNEGVKGRLIRNLYSEIEQLQSEGVEIGNTSPKLNSTNVIDVAPSVEIVNCLKLIRDIQERKNMSQNNSQSESTDYVSLLNLLWQSKAITEPKYAFNTGEPWTCTCTCTYLLTGETLTGVGSGFTKRDAKRAAACAVYNQIVVKSNDTAAKEKENALSGAMQQMNMSSPDQVPIVKTTGIDASLTAGSQVFSNTQFAQGVTDLNNVAFALNNIAQTGAPFDIRDSCKTIYQIEGNYTVSGVQGVGSEVFRLSLDPEQRPLLHKQYIQMHEDHIPSVDFGIYIGGAAGAIGTLKIGFVKDISKPSFSLADIQQIASQDVSLGQTSTVNFVLRDIRRVGLYRKVIGDTEPYPGIVAIISNPITNVQRNDSVQYPIQVYSKLSADYQLATPTAISNAPSNPTEILLSSYFELPDFDIVVNSSAVTNSPSETIEYDDCGWNTGKFAPVFSAKNIYLFGTEHKSNNMKTIYSVDDQKVGSGTDDITSACVINTIGFGFGLLPARDHPNVGNRIDVSGTAGFTVWKIQSFDILIGDLKYTCNTMLISDFGCVIVATIGTTIGDATFVKQNTFSTPPKILTPYLAIPSKADTNSAIAYSQRSATSVPYYAVGGINLNYKQSDNTWGYVTQQRGINPTPDWVLTPSTETFSAEFGTLYQWTFTGTGNNASTSSAPTGLTRLFFVRPGSTLNSGFPVNAPQIPGMLRLVRNLDSYLESTKGEFLSMTFGQDAISADFQVAYKNGVFLVRQATANQIRTSLKTTSMLKEIVAISNAQTITSFVNTGFSSWISSSSKSFVNKFAIKAAIAGASFQMAGWATAASAAGGLFSGMASGMQNSINWDNYNKNQDLNRQMQMQLMQMQGQNQQALSKQNFDQSLSLKGLTSTSSQAGNNQIRPTTELNEPDRGTVQFTSGGSLSDEARGMTTGNDIHGLTADTSSSRVLNFTTNNALLSRALTTNDDPDTKDRIIAAQTEDESDDSSNGAPPTPSVPQPGTSASTQP